MLGRVSARFGVHRAGVACEGFDQEAVLRLLRGGLRNLVQQLDVARHDARLELLPAQPVQALHVEGSQVRVLRDDRGDYVLLAGTPLAEVTPYT